LWSHSSLESQTGNSSLQILCIQAVINRQLQISWSFVLPDTNLTASISDLSAALAGAMQSARGNSMIIASNIYYPYTAAHFEAFQAVAATYGYAFVGLDTCTGDLPADIYQNATWALNDGFCYTAAENCTNSPTDCGACASTSERLATSSLSNLLSGQSWTNNYQLVAIVAIIIIAVASMILATLAQVTGNLILYLWPKLTMHRLQHTQSYQSTSID